MLKNVTFKEALEAWSKPERLVLVTGLDSNGSSRVMTVGWFTRAAFRPPMLAIAINQQRSLYHCIRDAKEFVIAVPGENLARETLLCGTSSSNEVDRFKEYGLVAKPGNIVKAPIIENCLANFECRLVEQVETGDHALFVGEVVSTWLNESLSSNLLLVGLQSGYKVLAEEGPYRIGVVRDHS